MPDLFPQLASEVSAFLAASNKREYLIARAEKFFDQVVAPMDLPGPDLVIDPLLRAAVRPMVGRLYDEVLRKLESQAHAA